MPGIEHTAFANPDGSYVLVVTNQGEAREFGCRFEGKILNLSLPRNSIINEKRAFNLTGRKWVES
jgi:O-glycosyl hydrolase